MASFLETARTKAQEVAAKAQEVTSSAAEAAERTRDAANEFAAKASVGASAAMGDRVWGLGNWWTAEGAKSIPKSPVEEVVAERADGEEVTCPESTSEQVNSTGNDSSEPGAAKGPHVPDPSSSSAISSPDETTAATNRDYASTKMGKATAAAAAAAWSSVMSSSFLPSTSGIKLGPASLSADAACVSIPEREAHASEVGTTPPVEDSGDWLEIGEEVDHSRQPQLEGLVAEDEVIEDNGQDPKACARAAGDGIAADNDGPPTLADEDRTGVDASNKETYTSGAPSSIFATVAARAQDYTTTAAEAAERTRGVASDLAARASEGMSAAVGERVWGIGDLSSWTNYKSIATKQGAAAPTPEPNPEVGMSVEVPKTVHPAGQDVLPAAAQALFQEQDKDVPSLVLTNVEEQTSGGQEEASSAGSMPVVSEDAVPQGSNSDADDPSSESKHAAAAGKAVLAMSGMRRAVQRTKDAATATLMRAREAAEDIDTTEIMARVEGGMEKSLLGMLQPVIEGIPSLAIAPAKQAADHFLTDAGGDVDQAIESVIRSVRVGVGTVVAEALVSRIPVAGTGAILAKTIFAQLRAIVLVGCLLGHDIANSAESQSLALFCLIPQSCEPLGDAEASEAADAASPAKPSRSQAVKHAARVVGKTVARKGLKSATGWKSATALFDICAAVLSHSVVGAEDDTGCDVADAARRASKLFRPLPRTDSPLIMGALCAVAALPVVAGIARGLFKHVLLRPWAPPLWLSLPSLPLIALFCGLRLRDWLYTSDRAPQLTSEVVFLFYTALPFLAVFDSTELVLLSLEHWNLVYACLGIFGLLRLARRESEAARALARTPGCTAAGATSSAAGASAGAAASAPSNAAAGAATRAATGAPGDGKRGLAKDEDAAAEALDLRLSLPEPAALDRAQVAVIVLALAIAGGDWASRGLHGSAIGRTHHVPFHIAKFAALLAEQALLERLRRPMVLLHYVGANRLMRLTFGLMLRGAGASLGALVTPKEFQEYLASVAPRPAVTFIALVLRVPVFFLGASAALATLWRMHQLELAWPLLAGLLGILAGLATAGAAGQVRAMHKEALLNEDRGGERLVALMPETTAKARAAAQSTFTRLRATAIGGAARSSTYFFGQYGLELASRYIMNFFSGRGSQAANAAEVVEDVVERAVEVVDVTT